MTSGVGALAGAGVSSASAFAASATMVHRKGSGAMGAGPKLTCNVTFRYETCG